MKCRLLLFFVRGCYIIEIVTVYSLNTSFDKKDMQVCVNLTCIVPYRKLLLASFLFCIVLLLYYSIFQIISKKGRKRLSLLHLVIDS